MEVFDSLVFFITLVEETDLEETMLPTSSLTICVLLKNNAGIIFGLK